MKTADVFIDGAYLRDILNIHFSGARIDFHKLAKRVAISHGFCLGEVFYYDGVFQNTREQYDNFLYALEMQGINTRTYALKEINRTAQQKEVDVAMAVEMTRRAALQEMACAIFIAGDRDFTPAIEMNHDDVQVIVVGIESSMNQRLREQADAVQFIDRRLVTQVSQQRAA